MIEPLSAITLASEGAAVCVTAVKKLKTFVESAKNARQDLQKLLLKVDRMRNILELLRITLTELKASEFGDMSLAIDDEKCQRLLQDLLHLANDVVSDRSHINISGKLAWARKVSEAESLVIRFNEQEVEITQILIMISTVTSIRSQQRIRTLMDRASEEPDLKTAFSRLSVVDQPTALKVTDTDQPSQPRLLKTWLGHTVLEGQSDHYVYWRNELSNACYWGEWSKIWSIMDTAGQEYHETWANAIRMKPLEESDSLSFWTPLHQAVYTGASVDTIRGLLARGAFRTLRARRSQYSYQNLSPLELAREIGASSMFDVLAPVIHNPIPTSVLQAVEENFHQIIRNDLGTRIDDERLYLPVLEVLTELSGEPMWFPIKIPRQRFSGYVYQLDRRDLIVRSFYVRKPDEVKTYRVTAKEILEIEEAISLI